MASFYAELRVGGYLYPLRLCTYGLTQSTDSRGRVNAKVRAGRLEARLDVPADDFLTLWAATAHMPLDGCVVFYAARGGAAWETVSWQAGHCVYYGEDFQSSDTGPGAYVCHVVIAATKLTMVAGGPPSPLVTPTPREHGVPAVSNSVATPSGSEIVSDCTESVRQNLQNQVKQNCKNGKQSCLITDNCPVLEETMAALNACIAARTKINMKCFKGGDEGHQLQIEQKINGLVKCQGYYFSKCSKTRQPVPIPKRAPNDEPMKLPTIPKEAPLTAAGVGLFILYLLSGALRPGPI